MPGGDDRLDRGVGRVGRRELLGRQREHPRDVDRDVPVPDHDRALAREVELEVLEVGVAVVPGDELGRRPRAGQVLAGDPEPPVGLRADGVDDRVVALAQLVVRHVAPDLDVAEEAEARPRSDLLERARDGLELRVVGRDAEPDEPPRRRQPLDHVDLGRRFGGQQGAGGVEAGRAGADDGDAERALWHGARCYDQARRARAGLVRGDHRLRPVAQAELAQHARDVGLDGVLARARAARRSRRWRARARGGRAPRARARSARSRSGGTTSAASSAAKRSISRGVTAGEKSAPPPAATRIAARSCSSGASLSRNPLAPARSASNTYSSRSKVVSTRTRGAARRRAMIRRVASMPSTLGMRTSMSTTSGCSSRASATGLDAVGRLADDLDARRRSAGSSGSPTRTSVWSSARRTRITVGSRARARA